MVAVPPRGSWDGGRDLEAAEAAAAADMAVGLAARSPLGARSLQVAYFGWLRALVVESRSRAAESLVCPYHSGRDVETGNET